MGVVQQGDVAEAIAWLMHLARIHTVEADLQDARLQDVKPVVGAPGLPPQW